MSAAIVSCAHCSSSLCASSCLRPLSFCSSSSCCRRTRNACSGGQSGPTCCCLLVRAMTNVPCILAAGEFAAMNAGILTHELLGEQRFIAAGTLRRVVRGPANAVYAEHASRNEHPQHRVSKYLASTRVRRALLEAIEAAFPLNNISH